MMEHKRNFSTFLKGYLWEHRLAGGAFLLCVLMFAAIFYLYALPLAAVAYPAILCAVTLLVIAGWDARGAFREHEHLAALAQMHAEHIQEQLVGAGNIGETFAPSERIGDSFAAARNFDDGRAAGGSIRDRDYQRIIASLCVEIRQEHQETARVQKQIMDYFTLWVHQIKTPLASMQLQLEGEDSHRFRQMRSDLLHIQQYVEMVLTYLKMGSGETDYVFRDVAVDPVIRGVIRQMRGDFILKRNALHYEGSEITVVTDPKWLAFLLGQILSNALKYTGGGEITITARPPGIICIEDTGIGIDPADLPRIFDQGFTGNNGRRDQRASGLGLYLCKNIAEQLGHGLSISSVPGEGTAVTLDLRQAPMQVK